ncbi:unnamed protein product [Coccothraustes coccothraustes]
MRCYGAAGAPHGGPATLKMAAGPCSACRRATLKMAAARRAQNGVPRDLLPSESACSPPEADPASAFAARSLAALSGLEVPVLGSAAPEAGGRRQAVAGQPVSRSRRAARTRGPLR